MPIRKYKGDIISVSRMQRRNKYYNIIHAPFWNAIVACFDIVQHWRIWSEVDRNIVAEGSSRTARNGAGRPLGDELLVPNFRLPT